MDTNHGELRAVAGGPEPGRARATSWPGATIDQAKTAVDELVKLHAPRWGDPSLADIEWLHGDPDTSRMFMLGDAARCSGPGSSIATGSVWATRCARSAARCSASMALVPGGRRHDPSPSPTATTGSTTCSSPRRPAACRWRWSTGRPSPTAPRSQRRGVLHRRGPAGRRAAGRRATTSCAATTTPSSPPGSTDTTSTPAGAGYRHGTFLGLIVAVGRVDARRADRAGRRDVHGHGAPPRPPRPRPRRACPAVSSRRPR